MSIARAKEILKHRFGFDSFRLQQQAAIEALLGGRDVVVLMPTGGGKSLCYQIPALMFDGLTLVVSPLIALMKDQVDALQANGIAAGFLNSTQSAAGQAEVFRAVRSGKLKILYVAPERLLQSGDQFVEFLRTIRLSLFAIDEAHCVSSWGHDFRPEYRQLARLKREFSDVPVIALTATADRLVRQDILKCLEIESAEVLVSSFNRPNISYAVEPKRNSFERLLQFLETRKDESGIIYCLSRGSVMDLAENLRDLGYAAVPYHAGLDKETRRLNQDLFLNDEARIVVATIAFGMGIDKSNVRFVVHMDLPKNIESYYQETGRAGRDGLPSVALLFFSRADLIKLKGFAEVENDAEQSRIMLRKLAIMGEFGDLKTCRRRYLLEYFSEATTEDCANCDNCTTSFEKFDGTIIAQKALSAVARTGQRFGLNYLIDFLRGSRSQKIWNEHKQLKTYGIGADISKEDWLAYFRDLISQGLISQADGEFPVLFLNSESDAVLRGQRNVELFKRSTADDLRVPNDPAAAPPYIRELFDRLRATRLEFAQRDGVPPYVVFSDATLVEMAAFLPQNESDLLRISGVGDLKMEKYGGEFLKEVRGYCLENGLESRIALKNTARKQKSRTKRDSGGEDTYSISLKLFRSGLSADKIAAARGLALTTIETHLARFVTRGDVRLDELVPAEKVEVIRSAIMKVNVGPAIGPVKAALGEDYSYGEIKAVAADLLREE